MSAAAGDFGGIDLEAIDGLQARLGYRFQDLTMLVDALTHRSWAAEHERCRTNERLEFLGDAVLGYAIADMCYRRLPDLGEGELTGLRKGVVNASALAGLARQIQIGPMMRLGRGEAGGGGAEKSSILSDAFEAIIGAIHLDGGVEASEAFVDRFFSPLLDEVLDNLARIDEKSTLQELAVRLGSRPPQYEVESTGPDHQKRFTAHVDVAGVSASGAGRSKKAAQQAAAHDAVTALLELHPDLEF